MTAKKLLASVFAAPGNLRVDDKTITLRLEIASRKDERQAIAALFQTINSRNLTLPGDPESRPLRFHTHV